MEWYESLLLCLVVVSSVVGVATAFIHGERNRRLSMRKSEITRLIK